MKKIYLFIFLLVSGLGFGQSPPVGFYEIYFNGTTYGDEHHNCGTAFVMLEFETSTDNYKALDITYSDDRATNTHTKGTTFSADKKPVSMYFSASRYDKKSCNGNRPNNAGRIYTTDKFLCLDYNFQFKQFKNAIDEGDGIATSSFNVKVRPQLVIIDPGNKNELATDKPTTIESHTGFFPSEYNWEYSFTPNNARSWVNLPQFFGKSSFTTDAKGVLGINAGEFHGRQIYFRQKACGVFSTPVKYVIRQSAPEIVSKSEEKTRCYDTKDGKLTLKFNRPLFAGEKLSYSIRQYDQEKNMWMEPTCSLQDGETISLDNTDSFQFPCNFSKGQYGIAFTGYINGNNTGSPHTEANPYIFNIESPSPVDFSIKKKYDINCYGGQDGAIDIEASGGIENGIYQHSIDNGAKWVNFSDGAKTTIQNLSLGKCLIKVRKLKNASELVGCIAKIDETNEKVLSQEIGQPLSALTLVKIDPKNPTFNKAKNGSIIASISGGTAINGNSYSFIWKNSKGDTLDISKSSTKFLNGIFAITLNNVPDDTYTLLVTDARNCTLDPANIPSLTVVLKEPDPIKITLEIFKGISCNKSNLDPTGSNGEESDAVLVAKVTGGIKIESGNNGLPYKFIWSKYDTEKEKWNQIEEYKKDTIFGLSKGNYSLNVIDANGISQGTFSDYAQLTKDATEQMIDEPVQMEVVFDSENVSCFEGENGWAKATIKEGKSKYKYTWYIPDGESVVADNISKLKKGTYYIEVKDTVNGCFVRDSIYIDGPKAKLDYKIVEITAPTFAGALDGIIEVKIIGGTSDKGTYNYLWKNAAGDTIKASTLIDSDGYNIKLTGIPADTYTLVVTDSNYDKLNNQIVNCTLEYKVELTEPKPLKVTFTKKGISCNEGNEFGEAKDTTPKDGQRDESQDGALIAHVTGGVTLKFKDNKGLPYFYTWKKQEKNGSWKNLVIQDSIAPNLSHGNYAFNIEDRNGAILGTYANGKWTAKDSIVFMQEPPKLEVIITKGDVFCYDGNDGWAEAHVTGGTPPYNYHWSNDVKEEKNTVLKAGDYWVLITDFNGCTTQESVKIGQPKSPLAIKYTQVLNPSFYKATNGKIVAEITGGTIFSDNSYSFEWKNSKGIVQISTTAKFNNGIYEITLNGVPDETYSLTIRDSLYNPAVNKEGCNITNSSVTLVQPEPLKVVFEIVRTISCNAGNQFGNETDASPIDNQRDESQDGILVAHVTGGIQLAADKNNGLPYYYTWKKQLENGSWIKWNDKDETAENISDGTYALNIEDANGIKLGTYVNNLLTEEKDVIQNMPQPDKLTLTFTKLDVGCSTGDDGWAEVHVTGGTPPYTYEWTNGETIPKIEKLTTNNYFVIATDAKGCVVEGSIFVGDPNGIFTTETVKNPTCFKGGDGSIILNVTGGNLPYSYLWNNGATTKDLNNLKAGNYEVAITCPDCCVYKKRFVLKDPEEIKINLGTDRTLCKDQSLDLDVTIADQKAQYNWTSTNGFTSNEAKVNVSKAGTYHVKVTSGLGCISEDEIVIKTSQLAISAEFLLSSQAYLDEEVILVNTSNPFGESTDWVIPQGVKVVEQKEKYLTLKFEALGVYSIVLKQTQGECYATFTKNITVEQRSGLPNTGTTSQFVLDFIVTPNPSNGNFKALVNLENNSAVNLRLFSTSGQNTMIQKNDSGKKKYEIDFETSLEAGMYILVLETGQQTMVKKIIIY